MQHKTDLDVVGLSPPAFILQDSGERKIQANLGHFPFSF